MNRLREAPTSTGDVEVAERADRAEQREVVLEVLAEPDPRVDAETVAADAGRDRRLDALGEELAHLGDDVVVVRIALHRLGIALHVHQDESRAARTRPRRTSPDRRRRRCR